MLKPILSFMLMIFFVSAFAQTEKDFQIRQNVGICWDPIKKLDITGRYRLSVYDNATRFSNSMFSLSVDYSVFKWLKFGGEYRFYTSYKKDYHRFLVFTRFDHSLNKFNLSYRLLYQQGQDYLTDQEYLAVHQPKRVLRSKLQLKYEYNRKLSFYVYAEAFDRYRYQQLNFYRMRYAGGLEYLYKRRHEFNVELYGNDEFNLKTPEDRLVLDLGYVYYINKQGKKKKKSDVPVMETVQP